LGRPIVFDCPANTTITVNPDAAIEIRGHVIIDGENKITLDAPDQRMPVFTVPGGVGASLVLKNIRIQGARSAAQAAASVVFSEEPLVLENVTIENSQFPIHASSDLTVRNSQFSGNDGTVLFVRGAVGDGGAVLIENSRFLANAGTAVVGGRVTTVRDSQFIGNDGGLLMNGGAIQDSLFQSNRTAGASATGQIDADITGNTFEKNGFGLLVLTRGVGTLASVNVARNLFSGNTSGGVGVTEFGTAPPPAGSQLTFEVTFNRFLWNTSTTAGGAAIGVSLGGMAPHVRMDVKGGVFEQNSAKGNGGAINWNGQQLTVSHALFRGNRTDGTGGAIFARPGAGGSLTIANSLIVENLGNGGAVDVSSASILNTTIAKNKGRGIAFTDQAAAAVIANTIIDQNTEGNCAGVAAGFLQRGNIQFGINDCPGVPIINPNLDSLYVPALGGAAVKAGDGGICDSPPVDGMDILFQKRAASQCTSGAYERPPIHISVEKTKLVKTCPDGTKLPLRTPCAEELKVCVSGQSVPISASCPCQSFGQVCQGAGDCCNNVPCTNGTCHFP
jgi:predicted outer membrane repeat protein